MNQFRCKYNPRMFQSVLPISIILIWLIMTMTKLSNSFYWCNSSKKWRRRRPKNGQLSWNTIYYKTTLLNNCYFTKSGNIHSRNRCPLWRAAIWKRCKALSKKRHLPLTRPTYKSASSLLRIAHCNNTSGNWKRTWTNSLMKIRCCKVE